MTMNETKNHVQDGIDSSKMVILVVRKSLSREACKVTKWWIEGVFNDIETLSTKNLTSKMQRPKNS